MPTSFLEFIQRNRIYNRGVLLGMTLAEVMILFLFCLLMAFVYRLDKERKETEDKIRHTEKIDVAISYLQEQAGSYDDAWQILSKTLSLTPSIGVDTLNEIAAHIKQNSSASPEDITAAITGGLKRYQLAKDELTAGKNAPPSPGDVKEFLQDRMAAGERAQDEESSMEALQEIQKLLDRAKGEKLSPEATKEAVRQILADLEDYEKIQQLLGQSEGKEFSSELTQEAVNQILADAEAYRNKYGGRMERLEKALAKAKHQLHGKGGLVFPSCFETKEGETQYVFAIEFDEKNLILNALPTPGNELLWHQLEFNAITTGESILVEQYKTETEPLYIWSVDNECRFVVKIIDRTQPHSKSEYKTMREAIEGHFYIKIVEPTQLELSLPEAPAITI